MESWNLMHSYTFLTHSRKVNVKFCPAMKEIHKWIFSHLRTANLIISFNYVEWSFYQFRRVNFKISEDDNGGDKMALSHNFSSLKGESV